MWLSIYVSVFAVRLKARHSTLPAVPSDFVQNYGCDRTVITGEGSEPGRVLPGEGGVQRALSALASMMATTGFLMFNDAYRYMDWLLTGPALHRDPLGVEAR